MDFAEWPDILCQINQVFGTVVARVSLANFHTRDLIATAHHGLTREMRGAWLSLPDHLALDSRLPHATRGVTGPSANGR